MEAQPIGAEVNKVLDLMERIYMHQLKRGFLRPRPKVLDSSNPRLEEIPAEFLEWWKKNRNCDVSPAVAWRTKVFRDEFYQGCEDDR